MGRLAIAGAFFARTNTDDLEGCPRSVDQLYALTPDRYELVRFENGYVIERAMLTAAQALAWFPGSPISLGVDAEEVLRSRIRVIEAAA